MNFRTSKTLNGSLWGRASEWNFSGPTSDVPINGSPRNKRKTEKRGSRRSVFNFLYPFTVYACNRVTQACNYSVWRTACTFDYWIDTEGHLKLSGKISPHLRVRSQPVTSCSETLRRHFLFFCLLLLFLLIVCSFSLYCQQSSRISDVIPQPLSLNCLQPRLFFFFSSFSPDFSHPCFILLDDLRHLCHVLRNLFTSVKLAYNNIGQRIQGTYKPNRAHWISCFDQFAIDQLW